MECSRRFKSLYSRYQRNRDLLAVGAYVPGADPALDAAIGAHPRMERYLQQTMTARADLGQSRQDLEALLSTVAPTAA
jgi:flagellum-specific ATP synthase